MISVNQGIATSRQGIYALTRNYYYPSFYRTGKTRPIIVMNKHENFVNSFMALSALLKLSTEMIVMLKIVTLLIQMKKVRALVKSN